MNSVEYLKQRLIAYKLLPEPHYQAIGEHLLDMIEDVESDIRQLNEVNGEEKRTGFIKEIDRIAREGTGSQIIDGDYIYTITVTKIHKNVAIKPS